MTAIRACVLLALSGTPGCGSAASRTAPPGTEVVTPMRISGPRGSIGSTELHNEARVVTHTLPVSLDSLWRALPAVYELLSIPQAGGDVSRHTFGNPEFRPRRLAGERLSQFVDCGIGRTAVPRADEYDVTMSVLTRLAEAPDGGTSVATTVVATGRPRAESGNPVHCPSTGALEARLVDLALRVLEGRR